MPAVLFIAAGALLGASGVLLGAMGAHGHESRIGAEALDSWNTAVLYQLVHALALVAVGISLRIDLPRRWLTVSGYSFIVGAILFCGTLYALALGAARGIAHLAPVGGVAFVVGWLGMLTAALRGRD